MILLKALTLVVTVLSFGWHAYAGMTPIDHEIDFIMNEEDRYKYTKGIFPYIPPA